MDNETIKQCECGSKKFTITEYLSYSANINKNGELETDFAIKATSAQADDNEIDTIICAGCGETHKERNFKFLVRCKIEKK